MKAIRFIALGAAWYCLRLGLGRGLSSYGKDRIQGFWLLPMLSKDAFVSSQPGLKDQLGRPPLHALYRPQMRRK